MSDLKTRRDLLKASASAVSLAAMTKFGVSPAIAKETASRSELRVAVIGTGGRGNAHIKGFTAAKGAKVVALCDADQRHVDKRAAELEAATGVKADRYTDYRELLDRNDIDVVTIATPNHWHALMTIDACRSGKHVYVEKPVCHTVWEGRQMVAAMQKYGTIVGAGFQNRSDVGLLKAMKRMHSGAYGAIKKARGLCYRTRDSIGRRRKPVIIPESLDYDLWLGPASKRPIIRNKLHYDWHWDFNTGNGDMGNQGPHEMDLLRWALGDPIHPTSVQSFGGRFAWDDAGNTPNMQCAIFDFGNGIPVFFEVRNLHQKDKLKKHIGAFGEFDRPRIIISCENGEFRGGRGGGVFVDSNGKVLEKCRGDAGATHMQNFVDAVTQSDASELRSPLESAYYSSCMSHLANISVLCGHETSDSELANAIEDHEMAKECFERFSQQLDLWNVDTTDTPWTLGPRLSFDPQAEIFTAGDQLEKANSLLRRKDREPHIVPEITQTMNAGESAGFVPIFDGKTLDGWEVEFPKGPSNRDAWTIADGCIVAENEDKRGSNLWTKESFKDFELELLYRTPSNYYDSGVFIRSARHQVQIGISGSLKVDLTGCIYAPVDNGGSYPARFNRIEEFHKPGQWNRLKIIATGKRIQTFLNGEPFVDYNSPKLIEEGPIGLQLHAGHHMKLSFKEIQLKLVN